MEDFIYLILLIAWVIFAFYRRSQKKSAAARQASSQPQPETKKRPFTLEDLFGEESEYYEEDEIPQEIDPGYQQVEVPEHRKFGWERPGFRDGIMPEKKENAPSRSNLMKVTDIQEDELQVEELSTELPDIRENIRQAVIYSEILNRPYD
ncbi:MAG: hypothetical protein R6W71_12985 [Bacteroidales bacterium]|jgi:hypothetical protein